VTPIRTLFTAAASFESARHLTTAPEGHRARRLHGHGFLASVRCDLSDGRATFPGGEVDALRTALREAVAPLDYRHLNEVLPDPTDARLAQWLRTRMPAPRLVQVGVRSSERSGVDLDADGRAHAWRRYVFQSAHVLPNVPEGHKCGRMHGHGFEAIVHVRLEPDDAAGLVHDRIDAAWAPVHAMVDHACLNDIDGLANPTSEMLSGWLWTRLGPALPGLAWITVYETGSCGAIFDGSRYRIWKEFTLDSARRLARAPEGSPLRRLHGHTYTLRLHLSAPLDEVMGWTVDFGDVKTLFGPVFRELDHRPLHEMTGIDDADTGSLARWILQTARQQLPALDRVDLHETPGCGAIAFHGDAWPAMPV
jgi:6-pyruvoyltetrahydropterin/6-carboxytetrahydropterin synthase